ncbi:MAG TPA: efflux RND transporter periplasmic adaptor subunit [Methylomirabilota bacterium]|nr:efflux RND transporter periplasmic adaptor subunit [Methylomirabilota bacterium]
MKRYLIAGALVGAALIVLVAARHGGRGETAARAVLDSGRVAVLGPTDVASAARADLIAGVPVSGTLEPAVDIRIASPIPEVVEQVLVKEGQAVRQGQVLARFRTSAVQPAALSAEAQRRLAASDYERMQNLFKEGAVSARDVENAEVSLRAAEATEAQAKKRLDEATVRAPVSGVVSQRAVESGDRVKDGDLLFQLVNTSKLEFEATVPSEYVADVRVGAPVVLAVTGAVDAGLSGRVSRVNATVDPATRQVKVYVTVPNRGGRLVGGLFASGRVVLQQVKGAVAVPQTAVRTDSTGNAYVLIVDAGRIARRDVTVGVTDEQASLVEIKLGLQGGETVIVGAASGLVGGEPVTIAGGEG